MSTRLPEPPVVPRPAASADESYGPDRTLIQVADWLSRHAAVIDALFAETLGLEALRIVEALTEQHPTAEGEMTTPAVKFEYLPQGPATIVAPITASARLLAAAVRADGSGIRERCVITDSLMFWEVYELTLRRNGNVTGAIRYWWFDGALSAGEQIEDAYVEQRLAWRRTGEGYVGQGIELRLISPYTYPYFADPRVERQSLLDDAGRIYDHPETVPYAAVGFRPLFQMVRSPDRISYEPPFICVHYAGENAAIRRGEPLPPRPMPALPLMRPVQTSEPATCVWTVGAGGGEWVLPDWRTEGLIELPKMPGATSAYQSNRVYTIYHQSPWSYHRHIPDFIGRVVCERFRDLVAALEPGVHCFVPVAVYDREGRLAPQAYFEMIVGQTVRAVLGRCVVHDANPTDASRRYPYPRDTHLVADPAAVQGKHLWVDPGPDRWDRMYCSDALKRAVDAAHPRRLWFERVRFMSPAEFAVASSPPP